MEAIDIQSKHKHRHWFERCGKNGCGRLISVTDLSSEKVYINMGGITIPMCGLHRPEVVDRKIAYLFNVVNNIPFQSAIILNDVEDATKAVLTLCKDYLQEGGNLQSALETYSNDIEEIVPRFNNWCKSHKKMARIKKVNVALIGYRLDDLRGM